MTNGIDTMIQKSANITNVYYCKPHLIYSDCWTPETNPDTDIQYNHKSLNLVANSVEKFDTTEYPERLKKNGSYDITDALVIRPSRYLIACSETTHTSDALKTFDEHNLDFPFDKIDGGIMQGFAEIISTVVTIDLEKLAEFATNFCTQNKYGIIFPHETSEELTALYLQKFTNLRQAIFSRAPVLLVHVSRWRKTDPKVFQDLLDTLHKFNQSVKILTVNGLDENCNKQIIRKELEFPKQFANDDWNNGEKIAYDQRIFRVNLIPLLKNSISELQF